MDLEEKSPVGIFVKEKPVMAVLAIHSAQSEIYPSKVSQKIDSTYSHTINIISDLEESGLVRTSKEGRKRLVMLTEKGEDYAKALENLMEIDHEDGVKLLDPDSSLYFLKNRKNKE